MDFIKNYFKKKKENGIVNLKFYNLRKMIENKYKFLLNINDHGTTCIYGWFKFSNDFKKIVEYEFVISKKEELNINELSELGFIVQSEPCSYRNMNRISCMLRVG